MILCLDIGATSTKCAALNLSDGNLYFLGSIPTLPSPDSFFQALLQLLRQTKDLAHSPSQLGIAFAGFLNPQRTRLAYNPNIAWLENFPIKDLLQSHFPDLEIELESDSNAAALAEFKLGSGRFHSRFLCLSCGTGLGVGMIVDNAPLRFAHGCMGDSGHIILQPNGPLCTCGGLGCAEALISTASISRKYRNGATFQDLLDGHRSNDPCATQILTETGEWIGIAAASMASAFFPDHIAIAGGMASAGSIIVDSASRTFQSHASAHAKSHTTLSLATLGRSAALIGAAAPFW